VAGEYTIAGGLADARRLARQAQVMETATMAFLTRAGLGAGAAALDVGCGDGQVTIAMARRVGPRGLAVGWTWTPVRWRSRKRRRPGPACARGSSGPMRLTWERPGCSTWCTRGCC
jgi:Protein-L-isoaspartate(D-aspartate) O-methyltransferase (PCMT)